VPISRSFLILAAVLLIALPMESTGISHEDYDLAETELKVLSYFMDNAITHLNSSLDHGAHGDYLTGSNESILYSGQVLRAQETLSKMPRNIGDSYEYLNEYVGCLWNAEKNLSVLMNALRERTDHINGINSFSSSEWTRVSLDENLTLLDGSIHGLRTTGVTAIPACHGLRDDVQVMIDLDLNDGLSYALDNLDIITHNVESLQKDYTFEPYLLTLFRPIMREWSLDLSSIALETDPPNRIPSMIAVLDPILPGLSNELSSSISLGSEHISNASVMDMALREGQLGYLKGFSDLNASIRNGDEIRDQLTFMKNVVSSLKDLANTLSMEQAEYLPMERYDQAGVNGSLSAVSDLVDRYRDDLDGLKLVFDELRSLLDRICEVLEMNVLGVDEDGDGSISDPEAVGSRLPEGIDGKLKEAVSLLEYIENAILSMDPDTAGQYSAPIENLHTLCGDALVFSSSHGSFLNGITSYLGSGDAGSEALLGSMDHLNSMQEALSGAAASISSLGDSSFDQDTDLIADLTDQMHLYYDFLLRLLDEAGMNSSIKLTLSDRVIPYYGSVGYSVLAIERRADGKLIYIDDASVSISLDGNVLESLTINEGRNGSSIVIGREFAAGAHDLSASLVLTNGSVLSDASSFEVRRLRTSIGCDPELMELEPKEIGALKVWIIDEASRPVGGQIVHSGTSTYAGTVANISVEYPSTGYKTIEMEYPGDTYHEGSNRTVAVDVRFKPALSLSPRITVVQYGEKANVSWSVLRGSGDISVRLGNSSYELGGHGNGTSGILSLNSTIIGRGNHSATLNLMSDEPWCRDGKSAPVIISVLSPDEYSDWFNRTHPLPDEPEKPSIDNKTPPDIIPIRPIGPPEKTKGPWDFLPDGWFSDIIRVYGLFILLLVMIITLIILAMLYRKRIPRKGSEKRAVAREAIELDPVKGSPDVKRKLKNGSRERIIEAYCDVLDRTPDDIHHMTPREVSRRFFELGAPSEADPIPAFERGIYTKEGVKSPDPLIEGLRRLRGWVVIRFKGGSL
jgi:hypothetical protein